MLKTLRMYVEDLESYKNAFWEWEDAIFHGCEMFFLLSEEKQGTIHVDLNNRQLNFTPHVSPGVLGITVGLGMGSASIKVAPGELATISATEQAWAQDRKCVAETIAAKRAILNALHLDGNSADHHREVEVRLDGERVLIKATGEVLSRAWQLHAIDYSAAFVKSADEIICTATAIADMRDISKDRS